MASGYPPPQSAASQKRSSRASAGIFLILIALGHTAVGLWIGRAGLAEIARSGWINSVSAHQHERMSAFWFLFTGFFMLLLGETLRFIERQGAVPARIGWALLAFGLVGGLMIPVSGFWLFLPLGALILRRARTGP